jgi:hypothetical protein
MVFNLLKAYNSARTWREKVYRGKRVCKQFAGLKESRTSGYEELVCKEAKMKQKYENWIMRLT